MGRVTALPIPQPRAATPADATRRRAGRSLGIALLLGAAGAAVVLIASGQTWAEGSATVAGGTVSLDAGGRDVTGVPAALAVVGLAALVAVFAVRTAGRLLVSALLTLSGAGATVAALVGATDGAALDDEAARTTGDTAATVAALTHTAWPYVTAAGGVLILLAGLLALRYGSHWPTMSGRYERDGTPRAARVREPAAGRAKATGPATDPDRPEDIWKALDRGEDPTG
ncbi:Tryptophan-associated transmembrane protein [Streptomyces sp. S4.7]|uniref:TIGR02234 family membrane protein n=1 Tax=unclassified Streptomyces TaxID=2593676 RepID=UPI0013980AC0|nr:MULTISPECIES: TIGR02234 family membrane protein [unclassified Streptomyces]QHY94990.1 Tryptophan-associated transmembrane protein [Streptomyces sp. S4.7]